VEKELKIKLLMIGILLCSLPLMAQTTEEPPETTTLVANNSYVFSYSKQELKGEAANFLVKATASSQFVLLGEQHMDHEIPIFAGALFRMLHQHHGFGTLVVEQDPIAIEDALAPDRRGNAERLAAYSAKYPTLFEFDTDEDLSLLADVSSMIPGPDAIWGAEQATSSARALEELISLTANDDSKSLTQKMYALARDSENTPGFEDNWLIQSDTEKQIESLIQVFDPTPKSRADRLLTGLKKSAEIYGYYIRAEGGDWVGLYNNTVREALIKELFLERYHAASQDGSLPKALFKYGNYHLYHGKSPTHAYPIGNLAHEFAIVNGMEAYGIAVYAQGENYQTLDDLPDWMKPLLPAQQPTVPTLIDLRALRPYQRLFRIQVADIEQWKLRDLINGYDAIVLLPGSRPAQRLLGGRGEQ